MLVEVVVWCWCWRRRWCGGGGGGGGGGACDVTRPSPTARTSPWVGSSVVSEARAMPEAVSVADSVSFTSTRSCSGLKLPTTGVPPSKMPSTSLAETKECLSPQ